MSYARWSSTSEVYVYLDGAGQYICCDCGLAPAPRFIAPSALRMIDHLQEHRDAGDLVPESAFERLLKETEDQLTEPESRPEAPKDRMLQWFKWDHLPAHLQPMSRRFAELAEHVVETAEPGPERTVALRKLLEGKDAAVRAVLKPGG